MRYEYIRFEFLEPMILDRKIFIPKQADPHLRRGWDDVPDAPKEFSISGALVPERKPFSRNPGPYAFALPLMTGEAIVYLEGEAYGEKVRLESALLMAPKSMIRNDFEAFHIVDAMTEQALSAMLGHHGVERRFPGWAREVRHLSGNPW